MQAKRIIDTDAIHEFYRLVHELRLTPEEKENCRRAKRYKQKAEDEARRLIYG